MSNAILVLMVATALVVGNDVTAEELPMIFVGGQDCSVMIDNLSGGDPRLREFNAVQYKQWVQGFMVAMNYRRGENSWVNLSDREGQWLWAKNWCKENPLEPVLGAVLLLYNHLAVQQGVALYPRSPLGPAK